MLEKVHVVRASDSAPNVLESLRLSIKDANPRDSLLIRKITGLGPADVSLFLGEYSGNGNSYNGRRVDKRNPVITLEINPDYSLHEDVSGIRRLLHRTFGDPLADDDAVRLIFIDGDPDFPDTEILCYMEKFESELFEEDNVVVISLLCPDPFIRAVTPRVFEHPNGWTSIPFSYFGTADTGLELEAHINATTPVVTIKNYGRSFTLYKPDNFLTGDVIKLNTNEGAHEVTFRRGNVEKSALAYMTSDSSWITLRGTPNEVQIHGAEPEDAIGYIKFLKFTETFWGL